MDGSGVIVGTGMAMGSGVKVGAGVITRLGAGMSEDVGIAVGVMIGAGATTAARGGGVAVGVGVGVVSGSPQTTSRNPPTIAEIRRPVPMFTISFDRPAMPFHPYRSYFGLLGKSQSAHHISVVFDGIIFGLGMVVHRWTQTIMRIGVWKT